MVEHLLEGRLAVAGVEAALDLDRVAGPVERGRLAQQRPAAAVEEAADDLVLRVVVGDVRVLAHVPAGQRRIRRDQRLVVGVGEPLQEDGRPGLAVVEPVEAGVELLVVHAVAAELDLGRLGLGVLAEVALQRLLVERQDAVVGAQRVQHRPVEQVLERVVGPSSPPQRGTQSR